MVVDPCSVQDPVPLWIGGRTGRSLRRAVELGDGWMPFGLSASELGALVTKARATAAWDARQQPLELVLPNGRAADPVGDPEGAGRIVERLVEAGATALQLGFVHHSVAHYVEQLEAMVEVVRSREGAAGSR